MPADGRQEELTGRRRIARWTLRALIGAALLLAGVAFAGWLALRGSLPRLDGDLAVPGLSAPATVQRDALGMVTIDADNEADAMRALGYVHAQERYFEMDLMRRTAAGELAELFGPVALETDRRHRVHRMRARATEHLERIAGNKLPQLQAYTEGVNAGLADLQVRPWPYLLLRQQPAPWRMVDSALVGYAMYFDLQDATNARELALWRIRQHVPAALFALLAHDGSSWDTPLVGAPRGDAPLPPADQLDLRRLPMPGAAVAALASAAAPERLDVGSNNFAVSGALTADGRAIVADDMHLGLRAPNLWFRARLRYGDGRASGGQVDVAGFTLPGLPAVVVGSNGHVAWGFTNSYGDWLDWARQPGCGAAEKSPAADMAERCPGVRSHAESIAVAGADNDTLQVEDTRWGPVLHREADGSLLSLRWAAHLPGSLTLDITDFARATSLEDALGAADRIGLPAQNLVVGDSTGRIAWRLLGALPERLGSCRSGAVIAEVALFPPPGVATEGDDRPQALCEPWQLRASLAPVLQDPPSGRLWTANTRAVDGAALAVIGDGGYTLGARARQIRDRLFAKPRFTERDLLAIQLDDRALFLERWWTLLQAQAVDAPSPALAALAEAAATWQGQASTDSTSYRIVRAWRLAVHERIANGLTAPAHAALGTAFRMPALPQLEGIAWPLVTQRPTHLLPRNFGSWDALFEDAAREVRSGLAEHGPLAQRSWGERNTAAICHPLAGAIPLLGKRLLCMPADPLAGDSHMPRVAGPAFGASQRMVVAPGFEADGFAHMPGGQSGHRLSPYWGAGHADWVHGRPTAFLPGAAQHQLQMLPAD